MRSGSRGLVVAALAMVPLGCGDGRPESLSKERAAAGPGGTQLVVVGRRVEVREAAAPDAPVIGWLRAGAKVKRRAEPATTEGCERGWYGIEPSGFVCHDHRVTLAANAPAAGALAPPDRGLALPYRYARARRGGAVVYGSVPGDATQRIAEPYRRDWRRRPPADRRLGAGAADVPLDERGIPSGPPVIQPGSAGVGADGYRRRSAFFQIGEPRELEIGTALLPRPALGPLADAVRRALGDAEVLRRYSGVAMVGTVDVGERPMAITADGRFVAVDRLLPELASSWHGVDLREVGLPLGFALRAAVKPRRMAQGRAEIIADEEYALHQPIPLTGRFRTVAGVRYYFTKAGRWVRHRDAIIVFNRHQLPDFAEGNRRWLDVSLANQTLVAYEGRKPVYATLISSGSDRLGDPESGPSTLQGVFRVRAKHVTRAIDSREVGRRYRLFDAPWVMEFAEGFALVGSYWIDRFGEARSYHHVALSPVDARFLFGWLPPEVPLGWHGRRVVDEAGAGIVYVHK
jgi:hypothetical protein